MVVLSSCLLYNEKIDALSNFQTNKYLAPEIIIKKLDKPLKPSDETPFKYKEEFHRLKTQLQMTFNR